MKCQAHNCNRPIMGRILFQPKGGDPRIRDYCSHCLVRELATLVGDNHGKPVDYTLTICKSPNA